jgi:hypothetical protein
VVFCFKAGRRIDALAVPVHVAFDDVLSSTRRSSSTTKTDNDRLLRGAERAAGSAERAGATMCQSGGVKHHLREASVSEVIIIGLDIAKHVFHAHGADERGRAMFSKHGSVEEAAGFLRSSAELHRSAGGMWLHITEPASSASLAMRGRGCVGRSVRRSWGGTLKQRPHAPSRASRYR